jgi:L-fuculose-phosphate aldolase
MQNLPTIDGCSQLICNSGVRSMEIFKVRGIIDKAFNDLCDELIYECKRAYDIGLVTSTSGNASFIYQDRIYITASGTNLSRLTQEDLAVTSMDGEVIAGLPSKELSAHRAIYNHNPDVKSVFHLHGEYIAAYTCISEAGNDDYPAIGSATPLKVSDKIPMLPYNYTNIKGDYELYEEGAKQSSIFMQCNHGVFIGSDTCKESVEKAINLETNMKVYMLALSTGLKVNVLSPEDKSVLNRRDYPTNVKKELISY